VSLLAPCCKKWFDCALCHAEASDHALKQAAEMTMGCKKCKAVFRRPPIDQFEEADEFCPRCDTHLIVEAELPEAPRGVVLNVQASGECENSEKSRP
jgi:uncharacterized CHY-type Zn-finger protein